MDDRKTITQWCGELNIALVDKKYYDDEELYTIAEFEEIVPKHIQVPLNSDLEETNSLTTIASQMLPSDFANRYKALKKAQDELAEIENEFKEKLKTMYESLTDIENNSVNIDGIKFTYIAPSKRKTFNSKKLQEDYPDLYKKYLKESNVKSSIRTNIEW